MTTMLERLKTLTGHEVYVDFLNSEEGEDVGGMLAEVGADYLLLTVERESGTAPAAEDQWFIRMESVADLVHSGDCPTCAVREAQELTKNQHSE